MRIFKFDAFTLSEMVIVVVILGVIASFAIPNYFRGLEKQKERTAAANVMQVAMAAEAWQAATGPGVTFNSSGLNTINSTLRTDVVLEDDQALNVDILQTSYSITVTWPNPAGTVLELTSGSTGVCCVNSGQCIEFPDCLPS